VHDFAAIARELSALTGMACAPQPARAQQGGSINDCYRWPAGDTSLFVKLNAPARHDLFSAEADGLEALASARALRVPQVRALGRAGGAAFLALEWLEPGHTVSHSERRLGEGLARLHGVTATQFGWRRDNYIGRTPQPNQLTGSWAEFFREQRLRPQLALAAARGYSQLSAPGERLLALVGSLLAAHQPAAALLHGDLWGGNWLTTADGEPAIFDPAVYWGDPEADLAMTHLFGGFGRAFYEAYDAVIPPADGMSVRIELYNLYHVLNHLNLFGGGYLSQSLSAMNRLLAHRCR
jgi:protein-ribulosamine 3-kinase